MRRCLIDSTGYAAFKRGHRGVVASLQLASEIMVSPIVLGELHAAILKGERAERHLAELNRFLDSPRVTLMTLSDETAERYGTIAYSLRLMETPVPTHHIWIAAGAMQFGAKVLTTDRFFLQISQIMVDFHEV